MTYDQQLHELRVINLICRHNGVSAYGIARALRMNHQIVMNWVCSHGGRWGVYEDDNARLYLTWHHGGMEWRLPGGCVVDASEAAVV
jgi:hypothetical protein